MPVDFAVVAIGDTLRVRVSSIDGHRGPDQAEHTGVVTAIDAEAGAITLDTFHPVRPDDELLEHVRAVQRQPIG